MTTMKHMPQLFLRMALGAGFIYPVLDRIGLLGAPDSGKVAWGDWSHFVAYTHTLMPFASLAVAGVMALLATLAECLLAIGLIAGYKTKWMGMGAAVITLFFALSMMAFIGLTAPFQYPVFVFTGAGLLLAVQPVYTWSIDHLLQQKYSLKTPIR